MTTTPYPVHLELVRPVRFERIQLAIRLVFFVVLGMLGISLGVVFTAAFLFLPAFAALRLSQENDRARYRAAEGPPVLRALTWFVAISSYFSLVTDFVPTGSRLEPKILLEEEPRVVEPGSALLRVLTGIPSALVLSLLACLGSFLWVVAAVFVLVKESYPEWIFCYLAGLQRWTARLLVYQAVLVDDYPPFSLSEAPPLLPRTAT